LLQRDAERKWQLKQTWHNQLNTVNIVPVMSLFGSILSVDICTLEFKVVVNITTNQFSLSLGQKGLFFPPINS